MALIERCRGLAFLVAFSALALIVAGQGISYPEKPEEDPGFQNANKRVPLYSPGSCGENEFLYPGDQNDDWICDCAPANLYYPGDGKCYPAYQTGPCADLEIFVMLKDEVIPECIPNPCRKNNFVQFRNNCYELHKAGPCNRRFGHVVGVNETTLEIGCVTQTSIASRFSDVELPNVPKCPIGCKRFINKTCPLNSL